MPGSPRSPRRRWLLALAAALAASLSLITVALAVHDESPKFELDGNAVSNGDVDWDQIYCAEEGLPAGCAEPTEAPDSASWTAEPNHNASIFTGGGSKDPQDITEWAWKDGAGGLPDKDNLEHSFAARYDDRLYFGSDRFDNSGDAHQAFWFLQDRVSLGTAAKGGGTTFDGEHVPGDILVISNFSNGGSTSTIVVYKWDPSVSGNLRLVTSSATAKCGTANPDDFCGIVNPSNGTTAPWPFTDKSGSSTYLQGEFFEGGIDLSKIGSEGLCFASFLSETRSSTSTTATLKDFVLGDFASCGATLATTPSASVADPVTPGTSVTDALTVTGSGVTSAPYPTGTPTFFLCRVDTGQCDGTAGREGTALGAGSALSPTATQGVSTSESPAVNTSTAPLDPGRYCFRSEWSGDANYTPVAPATKFVEYGTGDSECFRVKDTSATSTAQEWLPNDTATVKNSSGGNASGTVTFTLYDNGTCTPGADDGDVIHTFGPITLVDGTASTNNQTHAIAEEPGRTISWKATYTPADATQMVGSTGPCEASTVTIDDDITTP